MSETYFDVLGLPTTATDAQINEAYRRRKWENARQPARLSKVEEAYRALANPIRRRRYLESLAAGTPPDAAQPPAPAKRADPGRQRADTELVGMDRPGEEPDGRPASRNTPRPGRQPTEVYDAGQPAGGRRATEVIPGQGSAADAAGAADEKTRLNPLSPGADGQPRLPSVEVSYQGQARAYPLQEGNNWIGRPSRADALPAVPLADSERYVSRKHARIFVDGASWTITDNSENGTLLNGKRLRRGQPSRLKDGDVIVIEGRQLTISLRRDSQEPR
jgi:curved DNA-binding protein CbpA